MFIVIFLLTWHKQRLTTTRRPHSENKMYTVTSPLPHRELLNPSLIAYSVMQIGLIVIYMYVLHFFSMLESWNFNFIPSNGLSKSIIIMRFIFAGQYNSYKVWQRGRKTSNGRNYKKNQQLLICKFILPFCFYLLR